MIALWSRVWHNPLYRFLLTFGGCFAFLYYLNLFLIGLMAPEGRFYSAFFEQHYDYITGLRHILIESASWILQQRGYTTFTTDYWLRVSGYGGVIIIYSCLGYGVMSFFTAFVVAWPKSLKSKLWFLPAGLLIIQLLNITRFMLLCLYWRGSVFRGMIDHHDLFNIILYLILLCIIYFWVRKSGENVKN